MHDPQPRATFTPGRFVANIMHFARVLRAAGLPVGPGKVLDAIRAVEAIGVGDRRDFYWTLHAVFVNRRDQRELFDQAFHIFWRKPDLLERAMQLLLPQIETGEAPGGAELARRLAEALGPERQPGQGEAEEETVELDATLTFSPGEVLQHKDFEEMSAEEITRARALIRDMRLPIRAVPTRRFRPEPRGRRVDLRRTLRRSLRGGGAMIDIARKRRLRRHPPLVILCDISGSMERYARMLLHFMHTVTNDRDRVHSFVFGTRLTNITRQLRQRDVDVALRKVGERVEDWSGGTRIGYCLHAFNRVWSRRVLAQGAVVLLITDGLDRDAGAGLEREIERLHKSCRRLIWLNPLLRYEGYAPIATGSRTIIKHVDDFRPVHNLESLAQLTQALGHFGPRRQEGISSWRALAEDGARPPDDRAPPHLPLRATRHGQHWRTL
ncbi:MAG TPA: VWA domain-containing protein [Geminicoccaceae bacterium]|nr:VWA domain-containing protein [Geminicoccaceae bacterium]